MEEKKKEEKFDEEKESEGMKEGNDKMFVYASVVIVGIIIGLFLVPKLILPQSRVSLDELHMKNLEGKLPPDKGYLYRGIHSFVLFDNMWYTQVATPQGTRLFNIPFHYSPRDVEDIEPEGFLNYPALDAHHTFYMTFDPTDDDLNYIAVSTGESVRPFIDVFGKAITGSCTKNETIGCVGRPIVDCDTTDAPVFYFATEEQTKLLYLDNCIIISGTKEEMLRATDRMLFDLLGIMR
jgi:hypothetical protein